MEYVTDAKAQRVRTTAEFWLIENETKLQPRFDVIEIYAPEGADTKNPAINHIEDAF
jgi:putative endonuclease